MLSQGRDEGNQTWKQAELHRDSELGKPGLVASSVPSPTFFAVFPSSQTPFSHPESSKIISFAARGGVWLVMLNQSLSWSPVSVGCWAHSSRPHLGRVARAPISGRDSCRAPNIQQNWHFGGGGKTFAIPTGGPQALRSIQSAKTFFFLVLFHIETFN